MLTIDKIMKKAKTRILQGKQLEILNKYNEEEYYNNRVIKKSLLIFYSLNILLRWNIYLMIINMLYILFLIYKICTLLYRRKKVISEIVQYK